MPELDSFFISCALGNEKHLAAELNEFWHLLQNPDLTTTLTSVEVLKIEPGGVLIQCPFHLGVQVNLRSKLANRVLWRLGDFQTQRQQRLQEKIEKILKSHHLEKLSFQFHVTSDQSKLFHEGRIAESLEKHFKKKDADKTFQLYLRIQNDHCVVSLDTSGEHLHRRQNAPMKAAAPLRETLAATLLRQLFEGLSRQHLEQMTLIDPCCGSGTLLFEAMGLYAEATRNFDFQSLPFVPVFLKSEFRKKNRSLSEVLHFQQVLGFDRDQHAHQTAVVNAQSVTQCYGISPNSVQLYAQDSMQSDLQAHIVKNKNCLVVSNLPYGHRVRLDQPVQQMIQNYHEKLQVFRSAWVTAEELTTPKDFQKKSQRKINNQGLPVYLTIFQNSNPPRP